jgi:hypothetical protein
MAESGGKRFFVSVRPMRRFALSGKAGDAFYNLGRFFRTEATSQHRHDELRPLSVVLQTARDRILLGAVTVMVDADA